MVEPTAVAVAEDEQAPPAPPQAVAADAPSDAPLVEEDLLVEDISIDGMCGVY